MPHYKLHYFGLRGRAEIIRLMFHAAGVPFEDYRIEAKDWPTLKSKYPFEQLPVLEEDGKFIPQSSAIVLHVAEACGLAGKSSLEKIQSIVIGEALKDLYGDISKFGTKKSPTGGSELNPEPDPEVLKLYLEAFKHQLALLDKYVQENLAKHSYLVGKSLTFADLAMFETWEALEAFPWLHVADLLAAYPSLVAHRKHIAEMPRFKEYLAKRPKTQF